MRRDPLSDHVLRRFREEADRAAHSNFDARDLLASHGVAWDDANTAWNRLRPHSGELDDRIGKHWREQYRSTCAELSG
ncbi:hypothetical protein [Mycolicibacterium fallax]|uniref:Uncharacterized protein n=1 Tax=Mycolicibacterium fallax TaxID=1793 RepID=A0A1X1R308_MYCFA|nr:hypothetical protein [Mycolicibacterium fallax]ORU98655.1 hypothetical protein AWC04_00280 [Mycolicibacterium fallax]BBY99874.1 hypothetical protein MFAL_33410 [Mycolicibacterium fallax]